MNMNDPEPVDTPRPTTVPDDQTTVREFVNRSLAHYNDLAARRTIATQELDTQIKLLEAQRAAITEPLDEEMADLIEEIQPYVMALGESYDAGDNGSIEFRKAYQRRTVDGDKYEALITVLSAGDQHERALATRLALLYKVAFIPATFKIVPPKTTATGTKTEQKARTKARGKAG